MATIKDVQDNYNTAITDKRNAAITDYEVRSLDIICINDTELQHPWWHNLKYLAVGVLFGIVFVKAVWRNWYSSNGGNGFGSTH
jgi:hypothetical protein